MARGHPADAILNHRRGREMPTGRARLPSPRRLT